MADRRADPSEPRTTSPGELPAMIAAADLRVYKRDRTSSPTVLCNGGLHFHALLLVPPRSRLTDSVEEHFRSNQAKYCGKPRGIATIHVRPVTGDHERVVDYVLKTVLRDSVSYDTRASCCYRGPAKNWRRIGRPALPGVLLSKTRVANPLIRFGSIEAARSTSGT